MDIGSKGRIYGELLRLLNVLGVLLSEMCYQCGTAHSAIIFLGNHAWVQLDLQTCSSVLGDILLVVLKCQTAGAGGLRYGIKCQTACICTAECCGLWPGPQHAKLHACKLKFGGKNKTKHKLTTPSGRCTAPCRQIVSKFSACLQPQLRNSTVAIVRHTSVFVPYCSGMMLFMAQAPAWTWWHCCMSQQTLRHSPRKLLLVQHCLRALLPVCWTPCRASASSASSSKRALSS